MSDQPTRDTVVEAMRRMDLCMMTTYGKGGALTSRPMSNNAQVAFDGDTYFFTWADTRKVREIEANDAVALDYTGDGLWLTLRGHATLSADPDLKRKYWSADIEKWFGQGPESDDILLIKVHADEAETYGRFDGVVDLR